MRLATFVQGGRERFGLVVTHPTTGEDWVFDPAQTEVQLYHYAARPTSPYYSTRPYFAGAEGWPADLAVFLATGEVGLDRLRRMRDYLLRFLEQTDAFMLRGAGFPLSEVKLRAPIPRPRLLWGLVQNSPAFWRHTPQRTHLNLIPQGHQRPQGSVLGPSDPIVIPQESGEHFSWNPELGVIIGQGGRNIPVQDAMAHVAGLTVITDCAPFFYWKTVHAQPSPLDDWYEDAMGSWGDKKSDTMCPVGPYLVTMDEIGNPYDLLIYTRQSGLNRDRSHTGAMALGIERTVSWLSSFHALQPGDIIHMASMGVDGLPIRNLDALPEFNVDGFGPDDYLESEIERVGVLRNPLVMTGPTDWRPRDHETKRIHPAPAVRDLIEQGAARIPLVDDWHIAEARHFWTVIANSRAVQQRDGLLERPYPRFLNAPAAALAASGSVVTLPPRATTLTVGCELAFVVSQIAKQIPVEEAGDYILGYAAMAVIHDASFAEGIIEPASTQERGIPAIYGRWGDGANVIGVPLLALPAELVRERTCRIAVDGYGATTTSTDAYLQLAPEVLAFLSQQITLFPGDVITLGPLVDGLTIPAHERLAVGTTGQASIDGLPPVMFTLQDRRAAPEGAPA